LQTNPGSGILLQRGIAILDCEAAALPGRFLPELGRSSERPFFFPRIFCVLKGVARSLMGISIHFAPALLLRPQNLSPKG
jgi:hypothetical protein